jgi:hypothetical protein
MRQDDLVGLSGVRPSVAVIFAVMVATSACSGDSDSSSLPRTTAPTTAPTTASSITSTTPARVVVGTIAATIAPEVLRLGADADIDIASEMRNALERIDGLLHIAKPVAVRVVVNAAAAIPEVGVGGFTNPASGAVLISLSAEAPIPVSASLTVWLRLTVAHELDHSKRILDGPGYGTTLGEALVSEGLADTFSVDAYPKTPPVPWDEALQPNELDRLAAIGRANAATIDTREVHSQWFFGAGDLPRWAGYTIGASWVRDFLTAHQQIDATAATVLSANEILGQ